MNPDDLEELLAEYEWRITELEKRLFRMSVSVWIILACVGFLMGAIL